ncbi:MAG: Minf_1886 family protein [Planctomycetota bacterium]
MATSQLDYRIQQVAQQDPRYAVAAYHFLFDALDFTMARLGRNTRVGLDRHITVAELLNGIRDHAIEQFGPLARLVFESWGVARTEDFGEIVFHLINAGLLNSRDDDRREDFEDAYSFREAFDHAYTIDIPWERIA